MRPLNSLEEDLVELFDDDEPQIVEMLKGEFVGRAEDDPLIQEHIRHSEEEAAMREVRRAAAKMKKSKWTAKLAIERATPCVIGLPYVSPR